MWLTIRPMLHPASPSTGGGRQLAAAGGSAATSRSVRRRRLSKKRRYEAMSVIMLAASPGVRGAPVSSNAPAVGRQANHGGASSAWLVIYGSVRQALRRQRSG